MIGPQGLRHSMKNNAVVCLFIEVVRSKTPMVFRMPVLCSDYKIKISLYLVNNRHYQITLRNRKRSSWHKIILNINENKCFHLKLFFKFINEPVAFSLQFSADSYFINVRVIKSFVFFRKFF